MTFIHPGIVTAICCSFQDGADEGAVPLNLQVHELNESFLFYKSVPQVLYCSNMKVTKEIFVFYYWDSGTPW